MIRTSTMPAAALDPCDPMHSYFAACERVDRESERFDRISEALALEATHVRIARPVYSASGPKR